MEVISIQFTEKGDVVCRKSVHLPKLKVMAFAIIRILRVCSEEKQTF